MKFYNKDTGKIIITSKGRYLIILDGKLYEAEFASSDTVKGEHLYSGEAWLIDCNWGIMI